MFNRRGGRRASEREKKEADCKREKKKRKWKLTEIG